MTRDPGADGVERLGDGVLARHRDEREVGARQADRAAERPGAPAPRRSRRTACGRAALGERGLERSLPGGDAGLVAADRDDEVVGRRVGHVEAHAADDLEVELGRHRDLGGLDPGGGGDGARDLHEGHGVEVGAGSQLDVVSHGGLLRGGWLGREGDGSGVDGAERTADAGQQVAAGGVPDGEHPVDEVGEVGDVGGSTDRPTANRPELGPGRFGPVVPAGRPGPGDEGHEARDVRDGIPRPGGDEERGRQARRPRQHAADGGAHRRQGAPGRRRIDRGQGEQDAAERVVAARGQAAPDADEAADARVGRAAGEGRGRRGRGRGRRGLRARGARQPPARIRAGRRPHPRRPQQPGGDDVGPRQAYAPLPHDDVRAGLDAPADLGRRQRRAGRRWAGRRRRRRARRGPARARRGRGRGTSGRLRAPGTRRGAPATSRGHERRHGGRQQQVRSSMTVRPSAVDRPPPSGPMDPQTRTADATLSTLGRVRSW